MTHLIGRFTCMPNFLELKAINISSQLIQFLLILNKSLSILNRFSIAKS